MIGNFMIGNFTRDWTIFGVGWNLRVQIDADDEEAYEKAKSQLRMIAAGRPPDLKEDFDGTE
jgi:hypothetical protein